VNQRRLREYFKLQSPILLRITFHTFRHWRATMLYHQTKDPYYVKQFLGHKSLKSTEIYITVEKTLFGEYSDEFAVKVASEPEEIKQLPGDRLRVRMQRGWANVFQEARAKIYAQDPPGSSKNPPGFPSLVRSRPAKSVTLWVAWVQIPPPAPP
jgi:hypothetical protein